MKLHTQTMLAAAVATALCTGPAWSQAGPPSGTPGSATGAASAQGTTSGPGARDGKGALARADRDFVTQAAMAGTAEVESSRLAVEKATSPAVRQFAQRMIDDHGSTNAELTTFAQSRGITPPTQVDRSHRKAIDGLDKRAGEDFDRAYMKMQVADHEKSVALFEKQAKGGKDPDLRTWAESKLPVLRQHLQMARGDAGDRAGGSGGTTIPGASSTQGATSSGPASGSAAGTPGAASK